MLEDQFLVDIAAEGMTDEGGLRRGDPVKESGDVVDGVGNGELGWPGEPMASHVPRQDAIPLGHYRGRRIPLMVINRRAVGEDDERSAHVSG
jgi:hypothetical protein